VLPRVGLPLCSSDRRIRWTSRQLVMAAILMVWQKAQSLTQALEAARELTVEFYGSRRRPGHTLQGFCGALQARTAGCLKVLTPALRRQAQRRCGRRWRWGRWVVLAVDGSRIDCPRTQANETVLRCAGKRRTGPQIMLTSIFHLESGLLWDWRRGPGVEAERTHLREMIGQLPSRTLLVGDAGFVGYDLLRQLQARGHDFLIRVGRGGHLLTELETVKGQPKSTVYLWPASRRDQEPLKLRLIRFQSRRQEVCLLTTLSVKELPLRQARGLYKRRWVVEVAYRSLKQTLGHRTMLSRTPELALVELDWALVGMWMLGLMAAGQVRQADLGRISIAGALHVVRRAMRRGRRRMPAGGLGRALRESVVDGYQRRRSKNARDWPHKKKDKPPSPPHVRTATAKEKAQLQQLRARSAA
jgi:hypothetical protein